MTPAPLALQPRARRAALKRRLDRLYRTFDRSYLETDPLAFVHRYERDEDREIVGFLASALAFGNVRAIRASLGLVLPVMGETPAAFIDRFDPRAHAPALEGLYHRWIRGVDLIALFRVLRRMRERSGSIGGFFLEGYRPGDADIGASLASFSERARALASDGDGRHEGGRRVESTGPASGADGSGPDGEWSGPSTTLGSGADIGARAAGRPGSSGVPVLREDGSNRDGVRPRSAAGGAARAGTVDPFFPSPRQGSACKRLNLYLRWMVRNGDGLDLGLWKGIARRQLVLPLDTHLVRLTRALGLASRRTPGWKMAVEATRSLAILDPDDPVKYDFSLSRLGILDLCLHGRDPLECRSCGTPRVAVTRASSRS